MANCGLRSCLVLLACIAIPGLAPAQSMEPSKLWEVGDKAIHAWTESYPYSANAKSEKSEWEVLEVTDAQIRMEERRGLRRVNRIYDRRQDGIISGLCFTVQEICTYSPAMPYADFPLQAGKRSTVSHWVQGETFNSHRTGECVAEALEKVKVPAGEFDSFKVSCVTKSWGKTTKGAQFALTEKYSYWMALASGKPIVVRVEFSNSPHKRVTLELVSVSFK